MKKKAGRWYASLVKIGGQLCHTVLQTTIYVIHDGAAVQQVAVALDRYNLRPA
jgi:hypothetical protein